MLSIRRFVHRRCASGFTLPEVSCVLALIGILSAVGLSSLGPQIEKARLMQAATRITGAMVGLRARAHLENRPWRVVVRENVLFLNAGDQAVEVLPMPRGVRLTLNSGGNLRIYPDGSAENATFRLHNSVGEKTVVINQRGRVRLP